MARQPRRRTASTVARPMPEPPPVTSTVCTSTLPRLQLRVSLLHIRFELRDIELTPVHEAKRQPLRNSAENTVVPTIQFTHAPPFVIERLSRQPLTGVDAEVEQRIELFVQLDARREIGGGKAGQLQFLH